MLKSILALGFVAFAAAQIEVGIIEDEITEALSGFLREYDPYRVLYVDDLHFILEDNTDIHLAFKRAHLVDFSNVECLNFSPPLISKELSIELMMPKLSFPADHYSADGTLKGEPYYAAGEGGMIAHNLTLSVQFHVDSFSLQPVSICATEGSLTGDFMVDKLEGQFENGEQLSLEFEEYGPVLIDKLEEWILGYSRFLEGILNEQLCHG